MLSNCIFIKFYHISRTLLLSWWVVVICFQIVSLSSSITSTYLSDMINGRLWFAFKLYLYQVLSHPESSKGVAIYSCDLLSNCIFIKFYHISGDKVQRRFRVVICFQIVSLSSSITSVLMVLTVDRCCDLLSNCIFIKFYHIGAIVWTQNGGVVICFQIVSLSSSITSYYF